MPLFPRALRPHPVRPASGPRAAASLRGILTLLAAGSIVLGLGTSEARAFDPAAMTPAQQAAFGQAVRDYLVANPQVLVEMVSALESREQTNAAATDRARLQAEADALYNDPASWVGGNPDGDVTLVEFIDYRCGFCRRAHPEVQQLIANDGNIRVIVKEFPILGPDSEASARFAIAVLQTAGPDAYKAAREALITLQGPASEAALRDLARDLRLDAGVVLGRMASPEVSRVIDANRALAGRLEINGTPTFVVEEVMVRGFVPLAGLEQIVAEARTAN
jgi:protein-disulfide isomerase